jgi:hypothetical protein
MEMTGRVKIKSIALPVEHGGWGFLFEPILLALPVAFGLAGLFLAIAAVAMFLLRHPFKIFARSNEPVLVSPRRRAALAVSMLYGVIATIGIGATVAFRGPGPLFPLLLLSPFALAYFVYDTKKQSRRLFPEIAGPVALAGVATGIAVAGGWDWASAWALWLILMGRTIPSIFYVRARLRVERGRSAGRTGVFVVHVVFGIAVWVLVRQGYAPLLALGAFILLWLRSIWGLSRFRRPSKAIRIGILEIGYGLLYVAITVAGYRLGI